MKEESNINFWQKVAFLYGPFMKNSHKLYENICRRIKPDLNRDMDVLELACGSGQLSFALAQYVRHWEATDFSEKMIEEAKKKEHSSRLFFSVQDATALPYAPASFDVVVIANALHIMPYPEKALAEISRVLKPGGILYAPTFVQIEGKMPKFRMRMMEGIGFHMYHKWNAGELIAFVSEHGFTPMKHGILYEGLLPLCFLKARKERQ
ncbi:class I SAM-dependent methyltransferase [Eisenbergiella tayi]|uniref:Demethylmenaquinone methyltransferase n=1 Tax=Eisenbergiella tayi TaxID=1432052 RepID=A0A1E3AUK4_9FIRM|nr:class I SAM-dependent methyltransferase [Eisenbergiella tayi]ODM12324.1 Demethylmenaquinone methyltransferase [Eisenbergiella tayi]